VGQKLETLTVRGKTYNKVVINGIDDVGVRIRHEAGTARLKFDTLPAAMRKCFALQPGGGCQVGR
jgi:hypothetical protein